MCNGTKCLAIRDKIKWIENTATTKLEGDDDDVDEKKVNQTKKFMNGII